VLSFVHINDKVTSVVIRL